MTCTTRISSYTVRFISWKGLVEAGDFLIDADFPPLPFASCISFGFGFGCLNADRFSRHPNKPVPRLTVGGEER